jgi:hypothetical protein
MRPSGTLRKKLGIWHLAENLQNNLWFQKLRFYTPDHSQFFPSKNYLQKLGEIRSRFFLRIPDRQLTFPIIPDFSRISGALKLDRVWRGVSGRRCHAAGFALEGAMAPCPCIATDSQWQRWTLLLHLLKLLWGS